MLSGRFTHATADRKSGGKRPGVPSLRTVSAVLGAVFVVPALIALGTSARITNADAPAGKPAYEIESANANKLPGVQAVRRQTAPQRSANPEPRGQFAQSSQAGRLDSVDATRAGSSGSIQSPPAMPAPEPRQSARRSEQQATVPAPATLAPVYAQAAPQSAAAQQAQAQGQAQGQGQAQAPAPSSATQAPLPPDAPELVPTVPTGPPPEPPLRLPIPKG